MAKGGRLKICSRRSSQVRILAPAAEPAHRFPEEERPFADTEVVVTETPVLILDNRDGGDPGTCERS